jgi:hypothetical protein
MRPRAAIGCPAHAEASPAPTRPWAPLLPHTKAAPAPSTNPIRKPAAAPTQTTTHSAGDSSGAPPAAVRQGAVRGVSRLANQVRAGVLCCMRGYPRTGVAPD